MEESLDRLEANLSEIVDDIRGTLGRYHKAFSDFPTNSQKWRKAHRELLRLYLLGDDLKGAVRKLHDVAEKEAELERSEL